MTDQGTGTPTAEDVATWMVSHFEDGRHFLYQDQIVRKIKNEFGAEFVYMNRNGNLAISPEVLKAFRRLTEHTHIWDRGSRAWRPRSDRDRPGRAQAF